MKTNDEIDQLTDEIEQQQLEITKLEDKLIDEAMETARLQVILSDLQDKLNEV